MRISRLTVDKLGVKLYDKVSAVVAELIANGYDADAELVTVRLPLNTWLATKGSDRKVVDGGYFVEVVDDGHGMTPDEAIDHYLEVGRNRRDHVEQGTRSREKRRPVMGRKGIGKLAPFGICKRIEVLSAGGERTPKGYLVSHFFMDYDKILTPSNKPVKLDPGTEDRTYRRKRGTTIRLSNFLPKRVPNVDTFHRQVASRFIFARHDFAIIVEDTRDPVSNPPTPVAPFSIPTLPDTRVDLSTRPVVTDDGMRLPVDGWLGLAKDAYKNEEMAGVRIYARNKIVATTRDFEQPAGYTGEFTMRSYLVGEVYADWLDDDDGDDLVRTDRQGILWDSEYGQALRKWGGDLIKEIGGKSRAPRRERVSAIFLNRSKFADAAKARYADKEIVDVAVDLAKKIGAFAAEDELEDDDYIAGLSDIILSVAPHKALIQAFQDFNKATAGTEVTIDSLSNLFSKTRIAEMASYSQIASERVSVIEQLEKIVLSTVDEAEFQQLLAKAPWLVEPTWSVISKNQALKTFKTLFEAFYEKLRGEPITLAIDYESKRPDFTLVSIGHMLHVVEIKKADHLFDDADFERMINYVYAFDAFFKKNKKMREEFSMGWRIDLVADGVELKKLPNMSSYERYELEGKVERITWDDFLLRAKNAHEMFLKVSDSAKMLT
jgi:hypothetical protein